MTVTQIANLEIGENLRFIAEMHVSTKRKTGEKTTRRLLYFRIWDRGKEQSTEYYVSRITIEDLGGITKFLNEEFASRVEELRKVSGL